MKPRDVSSWLAYQETLNPRLIDLGLERVRPVAARLGLQHLPAPVITVAGTNGKGSVVAFLEALSLSHGLRPGCYASPFLLEYNESVRVAGEPASDAILVEAFEAVESARHGVPLTAFECRTLAGVWVLRASGVDVFLLEVGLGGRLDAVNLFDARVGVIASIGVDHEHWLGRDLQRIAGEKAGIARPGAPLVCGDAACGELVSRTPAAEHARLVVAGRDYRFTREHPHWGFAGLGLRLENLPAPELAGEHQIGNAAAAIAAFTLSGLAVPRGARVARALARARIAGRLQRLDDAGVRVVDVAHNEPAARALADWLREHPDPRPVHGVCAMYRDKDAAGILGALSDVVQTWYLAPLPAPRGAGAVALEAALPEAVPAAQRRIFTSVEAAWSAAVRCAGEVGRTLAFGSFETVARVLRLEGQGTSVQ